MKPKAKIKIGIATMSGLMISGIMLSEHVFSFLNIHGGMSFARLLHMSSSYWGFVLMSFHIGLHWSMLLNMARKAGDGGQGTQGKRKILFRILGASIAAYGFTVFIRNRQGKINALPEGGCQKGS